MHKGYHVWTIGRGDALEEDVFPVDVVKVPVFLDIICIVWRASQSFPWIFLKELSVRRKKTPCFTRSTASDGSEDGNTGVSCMIALKIFSSVSPEKGAFPSSIS